MRKRWEFTHLTGIQVEELATYFSTHSPMKGKHLVSSETKLGEEIFRNGIAQQGVLACSACHGNEALGNAEIPRLSGQHFSYLYKQLMVFKYTDDRPRGQAMKQVIHNMSDYEATSISVYLSSLD